MILNLILTLCIYLAYSPTGEPIDSCPFCNRTVIAKQIFYEDDLVIALGTHRPIVPCHLLIIPKRHVERFEELTEKEVAQMGMVIKKVNLAATQLFGISSYFLHQKNGMEVGQSVPHLHIHFIGKQAGDSSTLAFILRMVWSQIKAPLTPEEIWQLVHPLQELITPPEGPPK